MAAANGIGFQQQCHRVGEGLAVERHRLAIDKADHNPLGLHLAIVAPERYTHDRADDLDAAV